ADRRRVFSPLRGGEAAPARRRGAPDRRPRRDLPQHRAAVPPAADDGGVAPARAPPDRMLALVLRPSRGAERGQAVPARLLYPTPAGPAGPSRTTWRTGTTPMRRAGARPPDAIPTTTTRVAAPP